MWRSLSIVAQTTLIINCLFIAFFFHPPLHPIYSISFFFFSLSLSICVCCGFLIKSFKERCSKVGSWVAYHPVRAHVWKVMKKEKNPFSFHSPLQANAPRSLPNNNKPFTLILLFKTLIMIIIMKMAPPSPSQCTLALPRPSYPPPRPPSDPLTTGFLRLPKSWLVPPSSLALSALKPSTDTTTCRFFFFLLY